MKSLYIFVFAKGVFCMGLDMSLYVVQKEDLDKALEAMEESSKLYALTEEEVEKLGGKDKVWKLLDDYDVFKYVTEVKYWRKANAIHKWFVDNLQGGVDDCRMDLSYSITLKQCEELRDLCYKAVNSKHPEKYLPTCSGFFFGSIEYDDNYMEDLDDTINFLERVIGATTSEDGSEYYDLNVVNMVYSSSW